MSCLFKIAAKPYKISVLRKENLQKTLLIIAFLFRYVRRSSAVAILSYVMCVWDVVERWGSEYMVQEVVFKGVEGWFKVEGMSVI